MSICQPVKQDNKVLYDILYHKITNFSRKSKNYHFIKKAKLPYRIVP